MSEKPNLILFQIAYGVQLARKAYFQHQTSWRFKQKIIKHVGLAYTHASSGQNTVRMAEKVCRRHNILVTPYKRTKWAQYGVMPHPLSSSRRTTHLPQSIAPARRESEACEDEECFIVPSFSPILPI